MPVQRGVLFPVLVGVLLHGRSGERVPAVRTRHHKRRVPGHDCRLLYRHCGRHTSWSGRIPILQVSQGISINERLPICITVTLK